MADPGFLLSAGTPSQTSVKLDWTDIAVGQTGVEVYKSFSADTGFTLVTTTASDAVTYTVTGLAKDTDYHFKVRTVDSGGAPDYSAYSDVVTIRTDTPQIIRYETLLATTGAATRPLPLLGHYAVEVPQNDESVGWMPGWQIEQIDAGMLFIPTFRLPAPQYNSALTDRWREHFTTGMAYCAEHRLPIFLKTYQPEAAFYTAGFPINFVGMAAAANPRAYFSGVAQSIVDAIDPGTCWTDCGDMFFDNEIMDWVQTQYPNPPAVFLINNNESTKLTSFNIASSDRVVAAYPTVGSYTTQQKVQLVFDLYEARFLDLWDGMKARMTSNWASVFKVVNYSPFNSGLGYFYGRYSYAPNYWGWRTGEQAAEHRRCDGFSAQWYNNGSSQAYVHYDQCNSPQMHGNWWPLQLDFIFSENAAFWIEMATWAGGAQDLAWSGMNPDGYTGFCLYGGWLIQPRAFREYQGATEQIDENDGTYQYQTYWDNLSAAVSRIHSNATLRSFWQSSTLVPNGVETVPAAWANASYLPADAAFDTTDNWFKLTTSVDPGAYSSDLVKVPVWAVARVQGTTPNQQWLVFAFSTDTARSNVTIAVPDYGNIIVDVPESGVYVLCTEGGSYAVVTDVPSALDTLPESLASWRDAPVRAYTQGGSDQIYYVHHTGSDSTGDGSIGTPYQTVAHAFAQCRDGYADHVVIKDGSNLNGQVFGLNSTNEKSGRSYAQPIVIRPETPGTLVTWDNSAYGTGYGAQINGRPETNSTTGWSHIVIEGLHMTHQSAGTTTDRRIVDFLADDAAKRSDLFVDICIQGCRMSYGVSDMRFQTSNPTLGSSYFEMRQCVIDNTRKNTTASYTSAVYVQRMDVRWYGCVFQDIWTNSANSYFGHGLYHSPSANHAVPPAIVQDCVFIRTPWADQLRIGAQFDRCIWLDCAAAASVEYIHTTAAFTEAHPTGTVSSHAKRIGCFAMHDIMDPTTGLPVAGQAFGDGLRVGGVDTVSAFPGDPVVMNWDVTQLIAVGSEGTRGTPFATESRSARLGYLNADGIYAIDFPGAVSVGMGMTYSSTSRLRRVRVNSNTIGATANLVDVDSSSAPSMPANLTVSDVMVQSHRGYDDTKAFGYGNTSVAASGADALDGVSGVTYGWAPAAIDQAREHLNLYARRALQSETATFDSLDWVGQAAEWDVRLSPDAILSYMAGLIGTLTPPEIMTITDEEDGTATVEFTVGANADDHRVEWRVPGDYAWNSGGVTGDGSTDTKVVACGAGTREFRVISILDSAYEIPSAVPDSAAITDLSAPPVPVAPTNPKVVQVEATTEFTLTWGATVSDADSITIEYSWTGAWGGEETTLAGLDDDGSHTFDTTTLDGASLYTRVRSVNAQGSSAWVDLDPLTVAASVPDPPSLLSYAIEGNGFIRLQWYYPLDDVATWTIQRSLDAESWVLIGTTTHPTTSTLVSVQPSELTYFRVFGVNANGDGDALTIAVSIDYTTSIRTTMVNVVPRARSLRDMSRILRNAGDLPTGAEILDI